MKTKTTTTTTTTTVDALRARFEETKALVEDAKAKTSNARAAADKDRSIHGGSSAQLRFNMHHAAELLARAELDHLEASADLNRALLRDEADSGDADAIAVVGLPGALSEASRKIAALRVQLVAEERRLRELLTSGQRAAEALSARRAPACPSPHPRLGDAVLAVETARAAGKSVSAQLVELRGIFGGHEPPPTARAEEEQVAWYLTGHFTADAQRHALRERIRREEREADHWATVLFEREQQRKADELERTKRAEAEAAWAERERKSAEQAKRERVNAEAEADAERAERRRLAVGNYQEAN